MVRRDPGSLVAGDKTTASINKQKNVDEEEEEENCTSKKFSNASEKLKSNFSQKRSPVNRPTWGRETIVVFKWGTCQNSSLHFLHLNGNSVLLFCARVNSNYYILKNRICAHGNGIRWMETQKCLIHHIVLFTRSSAEHTKEWVVAYLW